MSFHLNSRQNYQSKANAVTAILPAFMSTFLALCTAWYSNCVPIKKIATGLPLKGGRVKEGGPEFMSLSGNLQVEHFPRWSSKSEVAIVLTNDR